MEKVIEFLKRVFLSKWAAIVYLALLIFGYVGAVFGAIGLPIAARSGGMIVVMVPAVACAFPLYLKAAKWCYNKSREE